MAFDGRTSNYDRIVSVKMSENVRMDVMTSMSTEKICA